MTPTFERYADAEKALETYVLDPNSGLSMDQREQVMGLLKRIDIETLVGGFEWLWANYGTANDTGKALAGGFAQIVQRDGFWGRKDRAYAVMNLEMARQNDIKADTTVVPPVALIDPLGTTMDTNLVGYQPPAAAPVPSPQPA